MTFDPDATGSGEERQGALVAVVADDLIWASRIVAAVQRAGVRHAIGGSRTGHAGGTIRA